MKMIVEINMPKKRTKSSNKKMVQTVSGAEQGLISDSINGL
jgi:hypothetical protein